MAILDDIGLASDTVVAYALSRYLRSAYTGPTCRLKDSLAAEADFYPDGLGGLAQGSTLGDAPDVWGTGPFEIVTVYDQSGGGFDADVLNGTPLLNMADHAAGLPAMWRGGLSTTAAVSTPVNTNSLLMSMVAQSEVTDVFSVSQTVMFGAPNVGSACLVMQQTSDGDNGTVEPIGFAANADFAELANSAVDVQPGEAVCFQMLKPTAGSTTSDVAAHMEDTLQDTFPSATWDIRTTLSCVFDVNTNANEDVLLFEGIWVDAASTISDATRAALAQDQQAYYQTRDYVPAAGGTTLGIASEGDSALAISGARASTLGVAGSSAVALPISTARASALTPAAEVDTAQPLSSARAAALGLALETDAALALSIAGGATLGVAGETDASLPLSTGRVRSLALATTAAVALPLSVSRARTLATLTEVDQALPVTGRRVFTLGIAQTAESALPLIVSGAGDFLRIPVERAPIRATAEIGPTRAIINRAA